MAAKKRIDNQWHIGMLVAFLENEGCGCGAFSWNDVIADKQGYPPYTAMAPVDYGKLMPGDVNPRCEVPHWVPRVGDCWVDSWPGVRPRFYQRPHLQLQGSVHLFRDGGLEMHKDDLRFEYEVPSWLSSIMSYFGMDSALRKKVIKDDCYKPWPQPEGLYTGIFECQFYSKRLRMWRRIFIDDNLDLTRWHGVSIKAGDQELWYLLLHKAYSKFLSQEGYYLSELDDAWSARNCWISLTGGVVEKYRILNEDRTRVNPLKAFIRIQEALSYGSLVACCGRDAKMVYIATAVQRFPAGRSPNTFVHAIRVWLPWIKKSEWMETWMKCCHTLHLLSDSQRKTLQTNMGSHEVWMGLNEFVRYFDNLYLCSILPQLRPDVVTRLTPDTPVNQLTISGIWSTPETAPESRIAKIQKNPKYILSVCHKDLARQSELFPFVFVLQEKSSESRLNAPTLHKMKMDVFKICVVHEEEVYVLLKPGSAHSGGTGGGAAGAAGKWNDYSFSRYWLETGLQYLVVPRAMSRQESLNREFRLTVYSDGRELNDGDIDVQACDQWSSIFVTSSDFQTFRDGEVLEDLSETAVFAMGRWSKHDDNCGGHPGMGHAGKNPQLAITVPHGEGEELWEAALVSITLMQALPVTAPLGSTDQDNKYTPIGMRLYRIGEHDQLPLTNEFIRDEAEKLMIPLSPAGDTALALSFGRDVHQVQHKYVLPVGRYCAVFFMRDGDGQNTFIVGLASSRHLERRSMNFGNYEKSAHRRYFGRMSGTRWMLDL